MLAVSGSKERRLAIRSWGRASKFHDAETVKLVQALLREGSLSKADITRKIGVHPCIFYRWFPGGEADIFNPNPWKKADGRAVIV